MRYLKIQNNGVLDIRLISLMGATTKRDDKNKIGEFGTGLKYSMAYLLKNNIDFKIFLGEREVSVYAKPEVIGEATYEVIYIDDERTSITTSMCHGWLPWYIVRELYCNALDEGGELVDIAEGGSFASQTIVGEEGKTTFYVQLMPEITQVHDNWRSYFADQSKAIFKGEKFRLYAGDGKQTVVYRNGIRVFAEDTPSVFHYDFDFIEINEMREVRSHYDMGYKIAEALSVLNNPRHIEYFINNALTRYEGGVTMDHSWITFCPEWKDTIGDAKIISPELHKLFAKQLEHANATVVDVPDSLYRKLSRDMVGISALGVSDDNSSYIEVRDDEVDAKVVDAISILKRRNYSLVPGVTFKTAMFTTEGTVGLVRFKENEIVLSERLKTMGMFEIVTTIIEENEHLRTKHYDCTRDFQQHFINLYATELLGDMGSLLV